MKMKKKTSPGVKRFIEGASRSQTPVSMENRLLHDITIKPLKTDNGYYYHHSDVVKIMEKIKEESEQNRKT